MKIIDDYINTVECSVLQDLLSLASSHLADKGRLVFWWPDGKYVRSIYFKEKQFRRME